MIYKKTITNFIFICILVINSCKNDNSDKKSLKLSKVDGDDIKDYNLEKFNNISGFTIFKRNSRGLYEYKHNDTGIIMVLIPEGKFLMGASKEDSDAKQNEHPQHEVVVDNFMIAKYELSQGEWVKVMNSNPTLFKKGGEYPVTGISWTDCEVFCMKAGLCLPTEAQWEYACRGGGNNVISGNENLDENGWYSKNSINGGPQLRGLKLPNGFGIHDLLGNVSEWCKDSYEELFYNNSNLNNKNPECKNNTKIKILRGGSYMDEKSDCRATIRGADSSSVKFLNIGFRPAFYPIIRN